MMCEVHVNPHPLIIKCTVQVHRCLGSGKQLLLHFDQPSLPGWVRAVSADVAATPPHQQCRALLFVMAIQKKRCCGADLGHFLSTASFASSQPRCCAFACSCCRCDTAVALLHTT